MNSELDAYFQKERTWKIGLNHLRSILLNCGLTESLKWSTPCYTHQGKNIAILGHFKGYFCLSFFKGVLLKNSANLLTSPGENSQSVRIFRFTENSQILPIENDIKASIFEAVEVEKAGLKVLPKKSYEYSISQELEEKFNTDSAFKAAFYALTPGRQKGYFLFFSSAKQSQTRVERIEKYYERIMNGFGQLDCICGNSKRLPACDGSHRHFNLKPQNEI